MKKLLLFIIIGIMLVPSAFAIIRDQAIIEMKDEYIALGWTEEQAEEQAFEDVDGLIDNMESKQNSVSSTYDKVDSRVNALGSGDSRKNSALDALDDAESAVYRFKNLDAASHLEVIPSAGGTIPRVTPDEEFENSDKEASDSVSAVNRVLIAPSRPGNVPEGDIIEDFIPQLIKLLFGFASLAILIAFITSGVYMVISFDNEERVTKSKHMIYYTLIGFAFVVFAFAIVKAVTDIDFFRFI